MSEFIGRGEERVVEILKHLFPKAQIIQQMPIRNLLEDKVWETLGPEHSKHKIDIVVIINGETTVIEVNYQHGAVAEAKWQNVYKPILEAAGCTCLTIDDNECKTLFKIDRGTHYRTWQDYIDVINAINSGGVIEI